jgi:molecular chaperone HtpG
MINKSKLSFQIEVNRVLQILSNDIYDSPYALLRENIQNAFDAIVIRQYKSKKVFSPEINVTIGNGRITIKDNGVGMNEEIITNNFWKAGSSGKNTEEARMAGVVGTFGIGAMANFGVCTSLRVITHYMEGKETIETFAKRESLSVTEECIDLTKRDEVREPGTEVIAELDKNVNLTMEKAIDYLNPYVRYIKIPVFINGRKISGDSYGNFGEFPATNLSYKKSEEIQHLNQKFTLELTISKSYLVAVHCTNIHISNKLIAGDIALSQGVPGIYGLRNSFGLAPVPIGTNFNLGGVVNLSSLHPTAGREALSRESIEMVKSIISVCEMKIAQIISEQSFSDLNAGFLSYVVNTKKYDLAKNIRIEVKPEEDERWPLWKVKPVINGKKVYYFGGKDSKIINMFGGENSYLLILSQENPRRRIQLEYLKSRMIEEAPNQATVTNTYSVGQLRTAEVAVLVRITTILFDDYLIADSKVEFAEISHGVSNLVEKENDTIKIYLSRDSNSVKHVVQTYDTAYEVFDGFVKDLVRNQLYQKFAEYVPSSTRQGAETLHKILMKNRELYKYESSDQGKFESLLTDLVAGQSNLQEVIVKSTYIYQSHTQMVGSAQVGTIESEIPSIIDTDLSEEAIDSLAPFPPIIRLSTNSPKKILSTDKPYHQLNDFVLFISLSDKVYRSHKDFFLEPHTTKVIWSMHRVVYIFTHASNKLSLYYDLELKERLGNETTGGCQIPTTTVVIANQIYIPIPNDLKDYFEVKEGPKEFYVRYDIIADSRI